ncbi:MAG: DUF192 domain-containing protein [Synergistales bacterium]|jgi:uncharacterized membrane protein (UPF0127 family)
MIFDGTPLSALGPDGKTWFEPVWVATTFRTRLRGLSFTDPRPLGVLFPGCRSIHSHWMRYSLDVLFLAEDGTVLRKSALRPWSGASHPQAASILEIPCGFADMGKLPDRLFWAPSPGSHKVLPILVE